MSDAGLKACAAAFGIASLGGVDQPSVKAILTFRPDLIVGFPGDPPLWSAPLELDTEVA
jgi:hypothetical protein